MPRKDDARVELLRGTLDLLILRTLLPGPGPGHADARHIQAPPGLRRGRVVLLILRPFLPGRSHGHAMARHIQRTSEDLLQVETGSLYPALYRLHAQGRGAPPPGAARPGQARPP